MQYQSRTIEDQPLRMASDALRAYPWATGVLSHPNIAEIFPRDYNVRPGPPASLIHAKAQYLLSLTAICPKNF